MRARERGEGALSVTFILWLTFYGRMRALASAAREQAFADALVAMTALAFAAGELLAKGRPASAVTRAERNPDAVNARCQRASAI